MMSMRETMRPVVAGIGEVLWDMLPSGRQPGGAPANFAYHAGLLGADASMVSMVGTDAPGDALVARLATQGLDTQYIGRDSDHPTGTVTVVLDGEGIPIYTIHENTAWDNLDLTAIPDIGTLATSCHAVCFGSLAQRSSRTRAAIAAFLDMTSPDCLHVFDINLRQQYYSAEIIDSFLRYADVLKLNDSELPVVVSLLGIDCHGDEAIQELLDTYGLDLVALTRGAHGSRLVGAGMEEDHPGYAARIADTVGAGDAFTAALTAGLLRGMPLDVLNDAANRVAAFVCASDGAMPALPDEIKALFAGCQW